MGCVQWIRLLLLKRKLYETRIGSMIVMVTGRFPLGRSGRLLQVMLRNPSKGCVLFGGLVAVVSSKYPGVGITKYLDNIISNQLACY